MWKWKANRYGHRQQDRQRFSYHGRQSTPPLRLILAAVCVLAGLLLIVVRILGMRFSGFFLLAVAALLLISRAVDWKAADSGGSWILVRRVFYGALTLGLVVLICLEIFIFQRGHRDESALPSDAVIVLGAGVNGTTPSLSLRTRLEAALAWMQEHPDAPAVLTGGQGSGEEITEARCMYNWLTDHGIAAERLILEETATNTSENLSCSAALLQGCGIDVSESTIAIVTNDFHLARTEVLADLQGFGATPGVPAKLPWRHLAVNYYLREAFALAKTMVAP